MNHQPSRRPPTLVFLLLGLIGLSLTATTSLQAFSAPGPAPATAPAPARTIPHTDIYPYGANVFLEWEVESWKIAKTFEMAEEAGIHWIKQQFPWEDIQLKPGDEGFWDDRLNKSTWEKYDRIVDLAAERGLELIVRLDRPPPWTRQDNRHPEAPPDNVQDYGNFVYEVVKRYRGKVRYYQIWNEPNIYPEWGDGPVDPAAYVQLLSIAYRRAKEADPNVIILSAPLAQTLENSPRNMSDLAYLEAMYQHGATDFFDVLFANAYGFDLPPDDPPDPTRLNFSRVVLLRQIMEKHGDDSKAIWFNEFGWNAAPDTFPAEKLRWSRVSEQLQAEYTTQAIQMAREQWPWAGAFCIWYFRQSGHISPEQPDYYFRMVDPGFTPRLVYNAVKKAAADLALAGTGSHEESNPALVKDGQWEIRGDLSASGGEYIASSQSGDNLTITFEGGGVDLLLRRGPDTGALNITVDGGKANLLPNDRQGRSLLDLHSQSNEMAWVAIADGLAPGRHVLRLVVTSTERGSQPVALDGFRITPNTTNGRVDPLLQLVGPLLIAVAGLAVWRRWRARQMGT